MQTSGSRSCADLLILGRSKVHLCHLPAGCPASGGPGLGFMKLSRVSGRFEVKICKCSQLQLYSSVFIYMYIYIYIFYIYMSMYLCFPCEASCSYFKLGTHSGLPMSATRHSTLGFQMPYLWTSSEMLESFLAVIWQILPPTDRMLR